MRHRRDHKQLSRTTEHRRALLRNLVTALFEHERIQIIADGQVYSPTHSYGVDSSRVLEEVMGSDPRAREVQSLLSAVSQAIGSQRFDPARELLGQIVERLGEADPEVTRIRTLLDFVEGKE